MRKINWRSQIDARVDRYSSVGAAHRRLLGLSGDGELGVIRVQAGGRLGRHPAQVPQALLVLDGSGQASGADGVGQPIEGGDLLLWEAGEDHETIAIEPLLLLVLETDGISVS